MLKRQRAKTSYTIIGEKEDILFEYFKYLIVLINEAHESINQIPFTSYENAYKKNKHTSSIETK
jgi:hypothetical protein